MVFFYFLISFRLKMRWKNMTLPFKAVAVDMDGTFLDDRKQFNHEQFDQILTELEKRNVHSL